MAALEVHVAVTLQLWAWFCGFHKYHLCRSSDVQQDNTTEQNSHGGLESLGTVW